MVRFYYSQAIYGFGNLNGFICPVSVIAFGLGAMLLVYCLIPICLEIAKKMNKKTFLILTITLFSIIMIDDIANLSHKALGLPTTHDFYLSNGWEILP